MFTISDSDTFCFSGESVATNAAIPVRYISSFSGFDRLGYPCLTKIFRKNMTTKIFQMRSATWKFIITKSNFRLNCYVHIAYIISIISTSA